MNRPSIPGDNDTTPAILSPEALWAAPTAPDPEALLREVAEMRRELGRRLMMPLPELLREGEA